MSKWTDIRDSIEDTVSTTKVDEQVKQAVMQKCYDVVLPSLQKLGDGFVASVKAQSAGAKYAMQSYFRHSSRAVSGSLSWC